MIPLPHPARYNHRRLKPSWGSQEHVEVMLCDAMQGPRCSLRSRTMYSDCQPDYLKITALNTPNVVVVSIPGLANDGCHFRFGAVSKSVS